MNVPSGYSALDLVGFTDKGDYSPSATYVKNDLVHYNGAIWKCLIDDTTGIVPTTGVNWDIWIDQSTSLDGLTDVEITSPTDGQEVTYDATTQKWKNTSKIQTLTNQVKDMNNVYGSKNILINEIKKTTNNGILCSVSDNGVMSLSGTTSSSYNAMFVLYRGTDLIPKTDDYVFYWGIATGSFSSYWMNIHDYTDNTEINLTSSAYKTVTLTKGHDYRVALYCYKSYAISGTLSISPMICLKSDWDLDPSYQPPAKTNQLLTKEITGLIDNQNVNGAVNMLPVTVSSQVINGVTFTVNADGTISAHTSGQTLTQNAQLVQNVTLPSGIYKQTGCPSGGSDSTYRIGGFDGNDYGNGRLITSAGTTRQLYFTVFSGMNIPANNPIVFKPMITVASYDGDYVPYAKSNKELTEDFIPKVLTVTPNSSYVDNNNLHATKYGQLVILSGYFRVHTEAARGEVLYTLPSSVGNFSGNASGLALGNNGSPILLIIGDDNTLKVEASDGISTAWYSIMMVMLNKTENI